MKVAVIILHFGDLSTTQECIKSLFTHETYQFSLIVVNNTGESLLKKDFKEKNINIINNSMNLGFAGGVNIGIQEALSQKQDAVLLLNNDTTITNPFLAQLVHTLQVDKACGIVAPVIQFNKSRQTVYDLGGHIQLPFGRTYHNEVTSLKNAKMKNIDYVSGCCMLIKKEVLQKIGLLDESFFLYYEDVDFCLRAKKKGFEVTVNSEVSIHHELSKSAGKLSALSIYHQLRSALIFGKKYTRNTFQRISQLSFVLLQTILFLRANPWNTIKALSAWKAAF